MNKKSYESPDVEKCILNVQASLMTDGPTVSDTGYGWADQGPVSAVNDDL